jgi:hypothetical protein
MATNGDLEVHQRMFDNVMKAVTWSILGLAVLLAVMALTLL